MSLFDVRENRHSDLRVQIYIFWGDDVGEIGKVYGRGIVDLLELSRRIEAPRGSRSHRLGSRHRAFCAESAAVRELVGFEAGDQLYIYASAQNLEDVDTWVIYIALHTTSSALGTGRSTHSTTNSCLY